MIFERITLHNFQRYRGENSIEFPAPGKASSIILVLAPNNSGKTTILYALRFLFYGHLAGYDRETAWNLATDLCRSTTPLGEDIEVWVEARVSIGGEPPITLRRSLQTRQISAGRWKTEGPFLFHKKTDRPNEKFQVDADGSLQTQIDAAVPQELFSWFYFAGEPAEGKMSHGNSRALVEPLKKAIQLRRWTDAIHTASAVHTSLKAKLQKEAKNHGEYANLLNKKDLVSRSKSDVVSGLATVQREIQDLQRSYSDIDGECLRTSKKAEESQKLFQRLKDQELKRDRAAGTLDQANAEISSLISKSAGMPLLAPVLPAIEKRLEALRKANLLPADISKGFIERLLRASNCVCGRVHDHGAKEHLEAYLKKTLATHTNNDLVNLANALEGGQDSRVISLIARYPGDLSRQLGKKSDAIRALADSKAAIEELTPQVKASSIEEFNKLVRRREEISREFRAKEKSRDELEGRLRTQEDSLKTINADLAKARPKRGAEEASKLENAIAIAERLVANLRKGQQQFQDAVYELLQERLRQHFDSTVTGGNRAKLDRDTLLPVIVDPADNIVKNPGGGEMQVLSIAFVAGLAELRTKINADLKKAGLAGRLLGEQSFVLDSPFTSADHNYMRAIADFLPNKAPQLLVLLAKQNWPDTVREALEPHIASAYGVTLHTSADAHDASSFEFQIGKKSVSLRKELRAGETAYTTFEKIF